LEYLQGRGHTFTVIPHSRGLSLDGTGRDRLPIELLATTVVAIGKYGLAVLVIPASRMLDRDLMSAAMGDPDARLATQEEIRRQFPDYDLGALPPLTMLLLAPMFVDPAVVEREDVIFSGGRKDLSIKMATRDLFGSDPVVIAPLTVESVPARS
jgi:prolyl-tRNA editing enzyme YbaK/EbsC (Cys-tRNA(Pro) deacylase)